MITFILNNKEVSAAQPSGTPLLEFIRYHKHLTGTKTGCNEGDCGACTVLIGEIKDGEVEYRSFTSCLTPLANVQGRHVVTIEGLNADKEMIASSGSQLTPVQQAMHRHSATQCGFCTPGFVVSLTGFCLGSKPATREAAVSCIDGNICRCTGYKSIEKAAADVAALLQEKPVAKKIDFLVEKKMLPAYFSNIRQKLYTLQGNLNGVGTGDLKPLLVGGGTDLYVQKHEEIKDLHVRKINTKTNKIYKYENKCIIEASATVTDLLESDLIQYFFPRIEKHIKLVSSTPIRNMATIAGNFINASPIGDFTIFFLALNAQLRISDGFTERELPLRKFYKGYKALDKKKEEYIDTIAFELPAENTFLNFEKVSKRTNLDIASVNSAIMLFLENDTISDASVSAGGVGPVPAFLSETSLFLQHKKLEKDTIEAALQIAQTEVAPISDARGTETYKRLLLNQLIRAHFIELFPERNLF